MLQIIENMIFNGPARKGINYLETPNYKKATGLRKAVLTQLQKEFQRVPPITLHFANERLMAAAWAFGREALVAGESSRVNRELVASITSQLNQCPFCLDVHSSMLYGAGDNEIAERLADGKQLRKNKQNLVDWAKATLTPGASILVEPPFADSDKPYLIATVLMFHYTNRMVNIFLDESPLPISVSNKSLKKALNRMVGYIVGRRIVSVRAEPGKAVYYTDNENLAEEFLWAKTNSSIARGLATFSSVVEEAGAQSLSPDARTYVAEAINSWDGKPMPLNRDWVINTIIKLPEEEKSGAELALLAALASYRIDDELIYKFKNNHCDVDLLNVTAWGAYIAMKRISSWIDG